MATLRTRIAAVLLAACCTAALGACGNEADDDQASDQASDPTTSATETPSESTSETTSDPASTECSDIWVDGQELPEDYTSCTSEGETIKAVKKKCGYGATFLEQDGRFYAMAGGPITDAGDLETSEEYQQLLATCQA